MNMECLYIIVSLLSKLINQARFISLAGQIFGPNFNSFGRTVGSEQIQDVSRRSWRNHEMSRMVWRLHMEALTRLKTWFTSEGSLTEHLTHVSVCKIKLQRARCKLFHHYASLAERRGTAEAFWILIVIIWAGVKTPHTPGCVPKNTACLYTPH